MRIFENSPRKWPNSHSRKLFLNLFEEWQNSILSRYSAITLHNIHLNAKSHNLLLEPSSRKYNLQSLKQLKFGINSLVMLLKELNLKFLALLFQDLPEIQT